MKVVYIAGPFRGETSWEVAENVRAAERVGLEVARLGYMPLIPHANTAHFDGCLPDAFWLEGTLDLLRRCDAVVLVPGWERSRGTKAEIQEAARLSIPVFQKPIELNDWPKIERWLTPDDIANHGRFWVWNSCNARLPAVAMWWNNEIVLSRNGLMHHKNEFIEGDYFTREVSP